VLKLDDRSVAAYVLAGWALVAAYPQFHFQFPEHPLWATSITRLSPEPPLTEARQLVESASWHALWANKQYQGPQPVLDLLVASEEAHRGLEQPISS
jgi:hypothetical protein